MMRAARLPVALLLLVDLSEAQEIQEEGLIYRRWEGVRPSNISLRARKRQNLLHAADFTTALTWV